ncbi:aminodeoxychorismate synthase component I [Leucothrix pacifica]|uniref:Aminodeoxychorismate synthase component I n=1 Tax=Leucothrix pacifica TaxID=1247513 RepID=A0A317C1F6_9GAMM|nr:aminodeoxychorismate synthase component I [Leucothrix pacifica]PWQ92378.1 aminodeoxychorismate synthase component I [Leucothrix pacifica]
MTKLSDLLQHSRPFILFENTLPQYAEEEAWLFTQPVREIVAYTAEEFEDALNIIDEERQKGHYLAGYISYEAGYALSEKLQPFLPTLGSDDTALLRFYAFDQVKRTTAEEVTNALAELPESPPYIKHWQPAESEAEYVENLSRIHDYISAGDTYQVNHTYRVNFELAGTIHGLYASLRERQPVAFSSLMHLPDCSVLSLSPELFIRKQDNVLSTKPMKGTAARGVTKEEDAAILKQMAGDKKQQSENLMIVDLMRNDIGRLAKTGTMKVSKLFEIQTYKTLHQMISSIRGEVDRDISFAEVIKGLFPCGSITGAPKIRTMEIIHELENTPRGIYTGAIGFITPDNDFTFNVPIRTLTFPNAENIGSLGIGGGIIYESDASDEWRESKLKARFLTGMNEQFKLIETFLYETATGEIPRLERHLERLKSSADFFGIPLRISNVREAITDYVSGLSSDNMSERAEVSGTAKTKLQNRKVRLLLDDSGQCILSSEAIEDSHADASDTQKTQLPKVALSPFKVEADNLFRQHKTTNRKLYNDEFTKYESQGFYDVLFLNEQGNIAEASRHNLFIEKGGVLFTPPIKDGALPGVMRSDLLASQQHHVIEQSLSLEDITSADHVYLSNSVRGLVEVFLDN